MSACPGTFFSRELLLMCMLWFFHRARVAHCVAAGLGRRANGKPAFAQRTAVTRAEIGGIGNLHWVLLTGQHPNARRGWPSGVRRFQTSRHLKHTTDMSSIWRLLWVRRPLEAGWASQVRTSARNSRRTYCLFSRLLPSASRNMFAHGLVLCPRALAQKRLLRQALLKTVVLNVAPCGWIALPVMYK